MSTQTTGTFSLMTKEEAALYLRISTSTLDRHVKSGTIKCHKIGKRVLFSKDQLTGTASDSSTKNS